MTIIISEQDLSTDCDRLYLELYGNAESVNGLTGRIARGELTDEEQAHAAGCDNAADLHRKLYPDHVGLDEFRQAYFEAALKQADSQQPPRLQPVPESEDADAQDE
jgi:hypothetical protein